MAAPYRPSPYFYLPFILLIWAPLGGLNLNFRLIVCLSFVACEIIQKSYFLMFFFITPLRKPVRPTKYVFTIT